MHNSLCTFIKVGREKSRTHQAGYSRLQAVTSCTVQMSICRICTELFSFAQGNDIEDNNHTEDCQPLNLIKGSTSLYKLLTTYMNRT